MPTFPDAMSWPQLLKDILNAWKIECEKKPATMSVDDAFTTLGLEPGKTYEQKQIRKAYFKMYVMRACMHAKRLASHTRWHAGR